MRERCITCERPLPLPKSEKSPPVKKVAYWIPADESEAHEELLDSLAEFLGCFDQPFHRYKAVLLASVALMQDESWRGFANTRVPTAEAA